MLTPPPGFEMNADSGGVRTRSGGRRDARGGGVISEAEIALTQSQPLPSQENPIQAANEGEIVQDEELHEEEPSPPRRSERIKQIIFNKPPAPGPGLREDDAIEV
ncbi:hypothetical protein CTI12_AA246060 [Artemisia annua]|uniref:Uncharacterized protein n=1 Tax=Artemisia annua TaxID=35608 RepID=A0A2U1NNY4_ARTAN|nr:hypothetical protein CTI12_AA246060 [Artemisia annua]